MHRCTHSCNLSTQLEASLIYNETCVSDSQTARQTDGQKEHSQQKKEIHEGKITFVFNIYI